MMQSKIKIFVMCYNDFRSLKLCLSSIRKRTSFPYELIVVDNGSTDSTLLSYFAILASSGVYVHRNKLNLWVLGLNPALKKFLNNDDKYFVVTDSDIAVPMRKAGECWLTRLVGMMEKNPVIGKLGISLDLGYLKSRQHFKETYLKEKYFQSENNMKISNCFIAPVDTTVAIYRRDNFVFDFPKFVPGHAVLQRPYYYTCRTPADFICKHFGWRIYSEETPAQIAKDKTKAFCFTFMGAYLDGPFLKKIPKPYFWMYKVLRPLARLFWSINVFCALISWFFKSVPFKLNEIQYLRKNASTSQENKR